MKPGQGQGPGPVFYINPGEVAYFDCKADSNPPNSYVWISKNANSSQVVVLGPRLEVRSDRLFQRKEYLCRAFNNVTEKQDETQFTLWDSGSGTGALARWKKEAWGGGGSIVGEWSSGIRLTTERYCVQSQWFRNLPVCIHDQTNTWALMSCI